MFVAPWVSYNIYKTNSETRAYISDSQMHTEILIEGISAELWDKIASKKSRDELLSFLIENNSSESDLYEFIDELVSNNLLIDNRCNNSEIVEYSPITYNRGDSLKEQISYYDEMDEWLTNNHFLSSLMLELTYKCNEKCVHCYNNKDSFIDEIKFVDIKSVIDEAKNLGVNAVTLSGGECTLAKDFFKISQYIREKKMKLNIYSNGQSFYDNPLLLDKVISLYPTRFSFSLYSMNAEIHDSITGIKGSHLKTLSIIKKLKAKNVDVEIKCFLTRLNIDNFLDVVKFAKENDIAVTLDSVFLYNKNRNNYDIQATKEQLLEYYKARKNITDFIPLTDPHSLSDEYLNYRLCKGGISQVCVSPNLELFPCPSLKIKLGDLKEKSLNEIFKDNNPNAPLSMIRKLKRNNLVECYKKEYCKYCSYCAGNAMAENGFLKKANILCTNAKSLYYANKK